MFSVTFIYSEPSRNIKRVYLAVFEIKIQQNERKRAKFLKSKYFYDLFRVRVSIEWIFGRLYPPTREDVGLDFSSVISFFVVIFGDVRWLDQWNEFIITSLGFLFFIESSSRVRNQNEKNSRWYLRCYWNNSRL